MNSATILAELSRLFDSSKTPGQCFDAIVNLRRDSVTWEQVQSAFAGTDASAPTPNDEPLESVPGATGGYDDTTIMPFGKHKGMPLADVPASYLHWLWTNKPLRDPRLEDYIKRNIAALKQDHPDGVWS